MQSAMLKLEVFETAPPEGEPALIDSHQAAKLREAAYEAGYGAGWQDALEHMRNEDALRRIAAEEALQQISFSYAEAHAALSQGFVDLTAALLGKLLPRATATALPQLVADALADIVAEATHREVQIACAPSVLPALQGLVAERPELQVDFTPEPSFTDAQVTLRMGAQERHIDLDAMLAALQAVLAQHSPDTSEQETAHG